MQKKKFIQIYIHGNKFDNTKLVINFSQQINQHSISIICFCFFFYNMEIPF